MASTPAQTDFSTRQRPVLGALLMLAATALISVSLVCAKALGTDLMAFDQEHKALPPFMVAWGRFAFALPLLFVVIAVFRPTFTKPHLGLHTVRVMGGFFGVTAMFAATSMIPLADTTAISFLNPIIAMVLAIWVLSEKIGPVRWATAFAALIGALFLIRPGMSSFQPAALLALLAAFLFAFEVIMLKILSDREPVLQVILVINVMGCLLGSIALLWFWQTPTAYQLFLLAGTGIFMVTAQFFFTNAMKRGDASFILPFSYGTLVFSSIYDFALFDVVPQTLSLIGGLIIICAGIVLAWRESRTKAA